jgi:hypothetical protein
MVRSTCSRHHRAYSTMKFVKPLRQSASPRIPIAALRPKPKASRDAFRVYVVCSWVGCFAVWAVDVSGKAPCCLARRRNHTASNLWTRHLANRAPRIHESREIREFALSSSTTQAPLSVAAGSLASLHCTWALLSAMLEKTDYGAEERDKAP